jgi:hypothetical protein
MTLSVKNVFRGLLFHGTIFHGPRKNGTSGGFAHEKKPALLSTESYCTAKTVLFVDDELQSCRCDVLSLRPWAIRSSPLFAEKMR